MSPTAHVIASAATSVAFYGVTRSIPGTIMCFLSGIFIDIDHLFDLWWHKKRLTFSYKELLYYCELSPDGKLMLAFHSYELFVLLWALVILGKWGLFWWGLMVGATVHIILDQIYNPVRPSTYFFIYRWKNGFSKECFFPPGQLPGSQRTK